jgi:hypothetical protein
MDELHEVEKKEIRELTQRDILAVQVALKLE